MTTAVSATINVTRQMPEAVEERLSRDYTPRFNDSDEILPSAEIIARSQGADGILCASTEKFTAEVIGQLPDSVKIIATFSVGYEHIDIAAAAARGITVTNTPDVLTEATADIAFLCLLGAARRAHEGDRLIRDGQWQRWEARQLLGMELAGRTLGILGMGRIGAATARRALGFGMKVIYHNRNPKTWEGPGAVEYVASLDDFLPRCDVLSIHAPSTPETYHIVNADTLAKLPQGAVVVNTARGNLVDDTALIAALRSGQLLGAGLDVFENEPQLNPEYLTLPNVFMLPHLGSATVDTRNAMGFRALDNLDAFFAQQTPRDQLTA